MKPYPDAQWQAIDGLGRRVDAELRALDVRLTQGGEPTFVLASGADASEWKYAALGAEKRSVAARLLRRLHARFAPHGLMHFGQGKWYPGETLPRWALGLIWRTGGAPVWQDAAWIAHEDAPAHHGNDHARRLIERLATKLGVGAEFIVPAYEDPWRALDAESRLPVDVDPLQEDLRDPAERLRLARLLREGLGTIAGYALPLRAMPGATVSWRSLRWPLRRERLYLVPGDSAIGHRLPLDTLPSRGETARTALCVQARDGRIHVFLPPLEELSACLALISLVEQCARELALPVIPEGYEPPADASLRVLRVTPDPGVIEVNVQPAAGWEELAAINSAVYEEARALGLATERYVRDGRRTGTGGGNHITLGGATPMDSPWLRRPDVLASLVRYWQNHPALSYLFAGQFVGHTSQAPRVDEVREDSLYELEIAFGEIERLGRAGAFAPEALVGLLRDHLVDATGNAHRAEFCIDKLWSQDGPAGELGLLELRAFEMAPHERMAAVQFLLVRALLARFWQAPYRGRLVPWGSALHDRFLLPHYIAQDMREVVAMLNAAGCAFEFDWLTPFFDFRFPRCGTVSSAGVTLELRHALEPWPVVGDAAAAGGTSRTVDASLERVQVRLCGPEGGRHTILCNGRRLPLRPTGAPGEQVAGIRFRARLVPRMLQPTIGLHTPLDVDIVDLGSRRSLGGCVYHMADPSGKPYESLPVNAVEAEARCRARFEARSRTTTVRDIPPERNGPDVPHTLDLRQPAEEG